ncbi:MAG: helix-turn-helix transcriptional regulator [Candidatus Delongbacteria bacterium]|jgi:transcriptional regulator with XRE-family HTH domain|nr:helix-turn-helix transcriptional regulator [Candidatus Delongbacteria bacterium]
MKNTYSNNDRSLLKKLGKKIRVYRSKAGLSQEQLALLCDLDRTYIGSVERGERNIAFINLNKVSLALNISISELTDFTNE